MWLVKVNAMPSVAWDTVPWKYIVLKLTAQMARLKKSMIVTVVTCTDLTTRKAAMATVTQVAGNTRPGQR